MKDIKALLPPAPGGGAGIKGDWNCTPSLGGVVGYYEATHALYDTATGIVTTQWAGQNWEPGIYRISVIKTDAIIGDINAAGSIVFGLEEDAAGNLGRPDQTAWLFNIWTDPNKTAADIENDIMGMLGDGIFPHNSFIQMCSSNLAATSNHISMQAIYINGSGVPSYSFVNHTIGSNSPFDLTEYGTGWKMLTYLGRYQQEIADDSTVFYNTIVDQNNVVQAVGNSVTLAADDIYAGLRLFSAVVMTRSAGTDIEDITVKLGFSGLPTHPILPTAWPGPNPAGYTGANQATIDNRFPNPSRELVPIFQAEFPPGTLVNDQYRVQIDAGNSTPAKPYGKAVIDDIVITVTDVTPGSESFTLNVDDLYLANKLAGIDIATPVGQAVAQVASSIEDAKLINDVLVFYIGYPNTVSSVKSSLRYADFESAYVAASAMQTPCEKLFVLYNSIGISPQIDPPSAGLNILIWDTAYHNITLTTSTAFESADKGDASYDFLQDYQPVHVFAAMTAFRTRGGFFKLFYNTNYLVSNNPFNLPNASSPKQYTKNGVCETIYLGDDTIVYFSPYAMDFQYLGRSVMCGSNVIVKIFYDIRESYYNGFSEFGNLPGYLPPLYMDDGNEVPGLTGGQYNSIYWNMGNFSSIRTLGTPAFNNYTGGHYVIGGIDSSASQEGLSEGYPNLRFPVSNRFVTPDMLAEDTFYSNAGGRIYWNVEELKAAASQVTVESNYASIDAGDMTIDIYHLPVGHYILGFQLNSDPFFRFRLAHGTVITGYLNNLETGYNSDTTILVTNTVFDQRNTRGVATFKNVLFEQVDNAPFAIGDPDKRFQFYLEDSVYHAQGGVNINLPSMIPLFMDGGAISFQSGGNSIVPKDNEGVLDWINLDWRFKRVRFTTERFFGPAQGSFFNLTDIYFGGRLHIEDSFVYGSHEAQPINGLVYYLINPGSGNNLVRMEDVNNQSYNSIVVRNCEKNWSDNSAVSSAGGNGVVASYRHNSNKPIPRFFVYGRGNSEKIRGKNVIDVFIDNCWPQTYVSAMTSLRPDTVYRVHGRSENTFVGALLAPGTEIIGASGHTPQGINDPFCDKLMISDDGVHSVGLMAFGDDIMFEHIHIQHDGGAGHTVPKLLHVSIDTAVSQDQMYGTPPTSYHRDRPIVFKDSLFSVVHYSGNVDHAVYFGGGQTGDGILAPSVVFDNFSTAGALIELADNMCVGSIEIKNCKPVDGNETLQINAVRSGTVDSAQLWTKPVKVHDNAFTRPPFWLSANQATPHANPITKIYAWNNRQESTAGIPSTATLSTYATGWTMAQTNNIKAEGNIFGCPNN